MFRLQHSLLAAALLAGGALAQSSETAPWTIVPESERELTPLQRVEQRSPLGLTGQRPTLSMTLPLGGNRSVTGSGQEAGSAFSWSLKAWQLNTASLAHIQCSQGVMTIDAYVAQDCRFVDQPLPTDSINLLQVSGDWMAAPGLQLGVSAFRSESPAPVAADRGFAYDLAVDALKPGAPDPRLGALEGLDVNVSFGIETERVGEFLLGLQLARYRQRASLTDLGMPLNALSPSAAQYSNSAQVLLGWRHGSFSGEMLGHHRELPLWLGNRAAPSTLNSFDLEFSWQALRNASLSIGVSNVMDAAPEAEDAKPDAGLEDPLESVYGRIPYVRYKHDL